MNKKETQLQQQIAVLRTRLLIMCAAVGIAVNEACEALATGNMGRAAAVVDGDAEINGLENEIDALALSILALNQPVAHDLRFVVAALRIVIDLERIGDEAVSIAERALILRGILPLPVGEAVAPLRDAARNLYLKAVDAFREEDAGIALQMCRNDEETSQLEVAALHRVMDYFCRELTDDSTGERLYIGMHGILICRALNRICRRAANIAEQTYFIAQGLNIKHVPTAPQPSA
ncbi:MAG: phosphate signaling complex protein PhoU [Desulfovibrio sp.]|jgi:phosphate transport system protein|nr:phosphate signaling complex protein PhoU [Desulfovibrio sp.]